MMCDVDVYLEEPIKAGIIFGYSDSREVFLGNFLFSCLVSFFSRLFDFFPEYSLNGPIAG